jgi:acetyl-CoA acetyltransferase
MNGGAELRGSVAVAGIGEAGTADFGETLTEIDAIELAARSAVADAGLTLLDIDGLMTAGMKAPMPAMRISEKLGLKTNYIDSTNTGGSSFLLHLASAAMAIRSGLCRAVLICYGSDQLSGVRRSTIANYRNTVDPDQWELPYKPFNPPSSYALVAARHMHAFGTTRAQLAEVAVAARQWAALNPFAVAQVPISIDDVLAAPLVSDPIGRLDCCLVTDGAGACVVVDAACARDMPHPPAYLLGVGSALTHRQISAMPELTTTGARESGARAYAMAGLGPNDIEALQLYDAFTINVLLFLEDLGFCAKGEGGPFVEGGRLAPGGELAVNTNGGGLSCIHPGMYGIFEILEAVRLIRGAGPPGRHIDSRDTVLCHGNGHVLSSQVTAILGSENAL